VPRQTTPEPKARRKLFDVESGEYVAAGVFRRADLSPGAYISGPALIIEDETTTVVAANFEVSVNAVGYLVLERRQ
jgi:N-methylhydantoinase A